MSLVDYNVGDFVVIPFNTNSQQGGAIAPSGPFSASDVVIYKWLDTSEKATTNGVIMFSPFNGVDGSHLLILDTSNSTGDVGFWESGKTYTVSLEPDETVDGETVVKWIGDFRLGYVAETMATAVASAVAAALAGQDIEVVSAFVGGTLEIYQGAEYSVSNGNEVDFEFTTLPDLTGGAAKIRVVTPKGGATIDYAMTIVDPGTATQKLRFELPATESVKVNPPDMYIGNILYKTSGATNYSLARSINVAAKRL